MSKAARSNRSGAGSGSKRGPADHLSPRVRGMVDELHAICEAVESGIPLERVATVRAGRTLAEAPTPSPGEIRAIRDSLGLSQAGFAEFLGAGLGTVRSWEHGQREPSALARRLLGAIRDDPAYWRGRLARMTMPPETSASARRGR